MPKGVPWSSTSILKPRTVLHSETSNTFDLTAPRCKMSTIPLVTASFQPTEEDTTQLKNPYRKNLYTSHKFNQQKTRSHIINKALHGRLVDSRVTSPSNKSKKSHQNGICRSGPRHSGRDRAVRMLSRMGPPARVEVSASNCQFLAEIPLHPGESGNPSKHIRTEGNKKAIILRRLHHPYTTLRRLVLTNQHPMSLMKKSLTTTTFGGSDKFWSWIFHPSLYQDVHFFQTKPRGISSAHRSLLPIASIYGIFTYIEWLR